MEKIDKKFFILLFFALLCFAQVVDCNKGVDTKHKDLHALIFMSFYFFGIISFIYIKSIYLKYVFSVICLVPIFLLDNKYLFLLLCPYFIIIEYISKYIKTGENRFDKIFNGINISCILGGACLAYELSKSLNIVFSLSFLFKWSHIIILVLFLFFIIMAFVRVPESNKRKKVSLRHKFSKKQTGKLKKIHKANVMCFVETLIFYFLVNNIHDEYYTRLYFYPWILYAFIIICLDDPVIDVILEKSKIKINYFE